jgi:hypothetical protein
MGVDGRSRDFRGGGRERVAHTAGMLQCPRSTQWAAISSTTGSSSAMTRRGVFLDLGGTLVEPLKPGRLDELTSIAGATLTF